MPRLTIATDLVAKVKKEREIEKAKFLDKQRIKKAGGLLKDIISPSNALS